MKCFKCPDVVCRTEYPEGSVQSVCPRCFWRSSKVKIPIKIPSVKSIPLEITPKSNIFDAIYINNGSSVDSMSQNLCERCGLKRAEYRMLIGSCRLCDECSLIFVVVE